MKKAIFLDILCCLFALLFLYTGISKTIDHQVFYGALYGSPKLHYVALPLSWLIPIIELAIAVVLFIPSDRRKGLYGFFIMMALFTIYIGFMVYFQTGRPCTCGGIISLMNWHQHFYFNSLFTLLAALAIWLDKKVKEASLGRPHTLNYSI